MKWTITVISAFVVTGCVTSAEYDRDQAFTQCKTQTDKAARDLCMEDAVATAQAERNAIFQEYEDEVAADERQEAVLEAYGVPEKDRRQTQTLPVN